MGASFSQKINQTHLSQNEKKMLQQIIKNDQQIKNNNSLRPTAAKAGIYAKFDLVDNFTNSLKISVQQVKKRIQAENDPVKKSQLTKQLQVKQKNLKIAQKFRPPGNKDDYKSQLYRR